MSPIIDIIVFGSMLMFVAYFILKPKLLDRDGKWCPDCDEEERSKYCPVCGTETERTTIEADWSDGIRNGIADEITPEETEILTEDEKKESYEEVYEIN